DAKVAALEAELSEVRSTLAEVQSTAKANQEQLLAMFAKTLGRFTESPVKEAEGSSIAMNSGGAKLSETK
ncbi:hypothetical protein A2U01_0111491, partial [Trifolium medium]|nr:hypothetical protein [Trifolium medium]